MAERQYETIIVGAGSAGAVIAARMTERAEREVLLIEAGPDYEDNDRAPRELLDGTRNAVTTHDWGLHHRPVPSQVLFEFPRGRVVGGSSAVNTCIALRGQREDFDEWAALGLREWGFDQCLPAFKRLENDMDVRDEWHGADGPIAIRRHTAEELSPWHGALLEGCEELGFERAHDFNGPRTGGYGAIPMNKVGGVRQSVARGYLTPSVRARPNLTIRASTMVRRVLFEGRRAVGVEVERAGAIEKIFARRVVVSSGAIMTPPLLVRSGVGPRALVERLGCALVADNPWVARRLLDHPGTAIFIAPKSMKSAEFPLMQTMLRCSTRGGLLRDDMQIQAGSFMWTPRWEFPALSLMATLQKPRGRAGTIEITSADPSARPKLDARFLDDPWDRDALVDALELMHLLAETKPMREHVLLYAHPRPKAFMRRAGLEAHLEVACASGYHPCGTVPMSADDRPSDGAADGRGRVRGTEGLIVADASLFPTIPSANIHLPTIMLGERFGAWLAAEPPT
jgi:choline dehydrogenase